MKIARWNRKWAFKKHTYEKKIIRNTHLNALVDATAAAVVVVLFSHVQTKEGKFVFISSELNTYDESTACMNMNIEHYSTMPHHTHITYTYHIICVQKPIKMKGQNKTRHNITHEMKKKSGRLMSAYMFHHMWMNSSKKYKEKATQNDMSIK